MVDERPELGVAERMFPEPIDWGIAEPDRAVTNVEFGTTSYQEGSGGEGEAWYEGGGAIGEAAVQPIVTYPPTGGVVSQGDPFEPVKIGILIDMELGQLLADWIDPTILAIEDAMNEGVYGRGPVELVVADARGLPRENYRKLIKGYEWLVDEGCCIVLGPLISDNCLLVQDTVNQRGVAAIGWTGAHRFSSEYCFTVANGDIPTEAVMCANWLKDRGFEKVGMFWEQGSSGRDYADYFRYTAMQLGLTITREVKLDPNPRNVAEHLHAMREMGTEGIYYGGYGYATFSFADAFAEIGWDPPRVMGTAFMFYSNSNEWARGLEGWTGIDQLGEDGQNPNYEALIDRMESRFGRRTRNVVVALSYDTARAAMHAIANANIPTPGDVKQGLEEIRWMPATNGGPGCYVQFGPHDHKGYKGDFLTFRELRGGELRFDGYYRPAWRANDLDLPTHG